MFIEKTSIVTSNDEHTRTRVVNNVICVTGIIINTSLILAMHESKALHKIIDAEALTVICKLVPSLIPSYL